MAELEVAKLDGDTPHERGVIHGEQFSDEIAANVDRYLDRFAHNDITEAQALEHADRYVPLIEDGSPSYAAEMRGVAEGSGLALELVVLVNVRYELLFSVFAEQATGREGRTDAVPDGCTSFGVQPAATATGRTYIGQNWDWIPDIEVFLMDIRRPDAPNALALTEAGLVGGKFGLNEHGIGFVVNGLVSENDGEEPYRKPTHIAHREILGADRFSDAVGAVVDHDSVCSGNVLIGHPEGELIDIERGPESAYYLYPEDHVLTHANHFEFDGGAEIGEQFVTDSVCRSPRLRTLLERRAGDIDRETLEEALRDHFNHPASICSHVDPDQPDHEIGQTNASAIMDLENRRMFLVGGPPCEGEYREYSVAP